MFIPNYERMIGTVVHWLDGHVPPGGLVVDLGAGTGGLSAAILDALPDVRVELVDVDPNMLDVAASAVCRTRRSVRAAARAVRGSASSLSRRRRLARSPPRRHP